ncbi:hypothetical protein [Rhizobium paknamense]|uniref:Uncharacterized protein n=1 Tax=Rhizobium paknamense TaxID=1206817 RepID=A0ABU0IDQ7_9HYPH|nr:hypothetical protein [Rhizobium paknamense]MDQ0456379.1 hypothetical protein [Rhizobium paknamense]
MSKANQKPKRHMATFVTSLFVLACIVGGVYLFAYHPGEVEPENPAQSISRP